MDDSQKRNCHKSSRYLSILNLTLKSKSVNIKGQNSFGPITGMQTRPKQTDKKKKKAMTVQRVSKESVEKLRVLSYFLPPEEAHEKKTFDSLLNRLIQTYTETSMNNRQKDMYNTLLEKEREQ